MRENWFIDSMNICTFTRNVLRIRKKDHVTMNGRRKVFSENFVKKVRLNKKVVTHVLPYRDYWTSSDFSGLMDWQ